VGNVEDSRRPTDVHAERGLRRQEIRRGMHRIHQAGIRTGEPVKPADSHQRIGAGVLPGVERSECRGLDVIGVSRAQNAKARVGRLGVELIPMQVVVNVDQRPVIWIRPEIIILARKTTGPGNDANGVRRRVELHLNPMVAVCSEGEAASHRCQRGVRKVNCIKLRGVGAVGTDGIQLACGRPEVDAAQAVTGQNTREGTDSRHRSRRITVEHHQRQAGRPAVAVGCRHSIDHLAWNGSWCRRSSWRRRRRGRSSWCSSRCRGRCG
jgi:hypothetical protein